MSYAECVILELRWTAVVFKVLLAFGEKIFADLFFEYIVDDKGFEKDFSVHFGTFFIRDLSQIHRKLFAHAWLNDSFFFFEFNYKF